MVQSGSMNSQGTITFVGAGPGAVDLITVRGATLLKEADLVLYAGSLVDRELVRTYAVDAELFDSAGMALTEIITIMLDAVAAGKQVVRLHTGDPSIYGAIQEQMTALDRLGIEYRVVPGVTSAFAAAATLRQELTMPEVSQTVIITRMEGRTPVPEREALRRLAAHGATLALYLSVGMIDTMVTELLAGGGYHETTPVAVVSRASWPDELVIEGTLADIAHKVRAAGISKQAVILVGEALAARTKGMKARSLLYDESFSHGCRA
ncbi:Cobalt-precorrin-4 C(11)-methyltransferase [Trichlorobacter ammonificans]|uniref:Cobalt-precorrin-4 C(11)-methyltransferase n=2 Tax=Trichlorobacter ammonificans TaxID=2916410 RepID=A0ABM9D736_9BACT|nr:Cobalt-precorrin-4 C(11)-methyltransferase [Trichlorobacter ammonificans]